MRVFSVTAAALAFAIGSTAFAATINVNIYTPVESHTLASDEIAGVVPDDNWNNVEIIKSASDFTTGTAAISTDGDGNPLTGVTLNWRVNTDAERTNSVDTGTSDGKLMAGTSYHKSGNGSSFSSNHYFELAGIPESITSIGYSLIWYSGDSDGTGKFLVWEYDDPATPGDASAPWGVETHSFSGDFIQGTLSDPGDPANANYYRIDGLSTSSIRIVPDQDSGAQIGFSGLQIIPVPEPASLALLAIGAALIARRRA